MSRSLTVALAYTSTTTTKVGGLLIQRNLASLPTWQPAIA
jgi:hypothetical protein